MQLNKNVIQSLQTMDQSLSSFFTLYDLYNESMDLTIEEIDEDILLLLEEVNKLNKLIYNKLGYSFINLSYGVRKTHELQIKKSTQDFLNFKQQWHDLSLDNKKEFFQDIFLMIHIFRKFKIIDKDLNEYLNSIEKLTKNLNSNFQIYFVNNINEPYFKYFAAINSYMDLIDKEKSLVKLNILDNGILSKIDDIFWLKNIFNNYIKSVEIDLYRKIPEALDNSPIKKEDLLEKMYKQLEQMATIINKKLKKWA